ncbi:MAG: NAD(P)/FAD-dependent oxidoreductase [Aeromonas sp.]
MTAKRIAIIGSGISGLTAGYLLHKQHAITLFEANAEIGGHTATKEVEQQGQRYSVDTGFIVFNDKTYPNFLRLLARLGVAKQPSEMSFSVKLAAEQADGAWGPAGLEYNGHSLASLFAQRRNLLRPRFYRLLWQIYRFNRAGLAWLETPRAAASTLTLGEFLTAQGLSDDVARYYLLPMGAAIWSASLSDMRQMPVYFFLRFFAHHGLLNLRQRPQWFVIPGGSKGYLTPITHGWQEHIRLNCPVLGVRRTPEGVVVTTAQGDTPFDEVIFACHSDQALALLRDASAQEQAILGALPYRANQVQLHTDSRVLPTRRAAWASWNYQLSADESALPELSYNMNILQGLTAPMPFCVSLNLPIPPQGLLGEFTYQHPQFSAAALAAQARRSEICGQQHTHFCGAYWRHGFHEDGVVSALSVALRFGGQL